MILVTTKVQAQEAAQYLRNSPVIYFDIETTGLDPYTTRLLIVSLRGNNVTFVFDIVQLGVEILSLIRPLLEDPNIIKVAHNAIFDWKHLYHHGQIYTAPVACTMINEQLLEAGLLNSGFGLDDLAGRYLNRTMDKTVREGFINRTEGLAFTEEELRYAAQDVEVLQPIYHKQMARIHDEQLDRVYRVESDLIPVTAQMEYSGVCVNVQKLQEAEPVVRRLVESADKELQDEIIRQGLAEQIVFSRDGYIAVNTGSPKQLLEAFNKLGIDVKTLGKKELSDWDAVWSRKHIKKVELDGTNSDHNVDSDLHIGYSHPLLRKHAIRTAAAKIHGTYIVGLTERINPVTGRLYPGYKQCGAVATGRFSSVSPRLGR